MTQASTEKRVVDSSSIMKETNAPKDVEETFKQQQEGQQHRPYKLSSVILFTAVPWIADFLYGYDCGAVSYAILQLPDEEMSGVTWGDNLSGSLIGGIVSAAALGAFLASSWIVQEHQRPQMGYIPELQLGAVLYLLGASLQASCRWMVHFELAMTTLITGRLIYGLGIGVSMHAAPAYLGEMSPSSIRGFCLSMKEAANVVGVLAGYQAGHYFSAYQGGWAFSFMMSSAFALTSLGISSWLPDSPRWLLLHDKNQAAKRSLLFMFGDSDIVEMEFSEIKEHLMGRREEKVGAFEPSGENKLSDLWHMSNRRPLIIGIGVIALQQLTGSPAMLAYASTVFEEAGQASNSSVHMAMFQLFMTLIAVGLVDRCGRRPLLLLGCAAMTIALVILVLSYGRYDQSVLFAMFAYIGGFQLGFGPIAWLVVAEVFPNELRAKATALCVQTNFLTYGIVQFAVPIVKEIFGFSGTFAVFAALSVYSVYFIHAFVPETSGMTLEAIESTMERNSIREGKVALLSPLIKESSYISKENPAYGSTLVV